MRTVKRNAPCKMDLSKLLYHSNTSNYGPKGKPQDQSLQRCKARHLAHIYIER